MKKDGDQAPAKLGQFRGVDRKNRAGIVKKAIYFLIKIMKKYLPYILILIAFLLGQFLGTQDKSGEELLKQRFEQEQQRDRDSISVLLEKLALKSAESRTIRERMIQDSLKYSDALERNQRAYTALKRKYNEINLSRATACELDSIITALYH